METTRKCEISRYGVYLYSVTIIICTSSHHIIQLTTTGSESNTDLLAVVNENVNSYWEYSEKAVSLFSDYISKFPQLWTNLSKIQHKIKVDISGSD